MKKNTNVSSSVTSEQVVSVQILGEAGLRYIDGIEELENKHFNPINISESQNRVTAIAPDDGTNMFIVLEYVPNTTMMNVPFTLYLIHRRSKHIIDRGRIMFAPSEHGGIKTFSATGDKIKSWDILTKPASLRILEKANRFKCGQTSIKKSEDVVELEPEDDKFSSMNNNVRGLLDPVERLVQVNEKFAEFVKTECGGDHSVTSVSVGLEKYLTKRGIDVLSFTREINFGTPPLFYGLLALKDLHPDLKPLLNVTRRDHHDNGTEKISITVGALLAKINIRKQKSVWEEVKELKTQDHRKRKLELLIAQQKGAK